MRADVCTDRLSVGGAQGPPSCLNQIANRMRRPVTVRGLPRTTALEDCAAAPSQRGKQSPELSGQEAQLDVREADLCQRFEKLLGDVNQSSMCRDMDRQRKSEPSAPDQRSVPADGRSQTVCVIAFRSAGTLA